MEWSAKWIKAADELGEVAPVFAKTFSFSAPVKKAKLYITAMGVYEANLNGARAGEYILAPGWTAYFKRLQYQEYDVTELLQAENTLTVTVGKGWHHTLIGLFHPTDYQRNLIESPLGFLAQLEVIFADGSIQRIISDESWAVAESQVRFSNIYDGEIYDASREPVFDKKAECYDGPYHTLIPQEGEEIREQEQIAPATVFTTPKGETVVDFGQNITGYVRLSVTAKLGEVVDLSFAEVLDQEGNFYTENYRQAKALYRYTCRDGAQTYTPKLTFWGFRYIRVNAFPGGADKAAPENFTAVVVHSQMKRTGYLSCSDPMLNQLFQNIVWGQKGNFLDVPTDCPQRDERLGWTGDAQVFIRTACLNYDVEKFFTKWLADLAAEQREDGYVSHVVPDVLQHPMSSTAWGDAAVICPWQIYLAYGDPKILRRQFTSMCKWVDYMGTVTTTPYLWTGGTHHYADWLGLDAPSGSYKGSSREDFIASAFYAYSTSLVIKAGKVLQEDVSGYEALYENIVKVFRSTYPEYTTQTECVLAAYFHLAEDCQLAADQLASMVRDCGIQLRTGFVGTPYLLHVLSDYGYEELAWSLLLRRQYPSWLYPITKGATTVWEHWDGTMEDGSFWSADMNSYNHYAYGAVADWVYSVAAGIQTIEAVPGYERVVIAPKPDARLDWLKATLDTRHGQVSSEWRKLEGRWRYEIVTPVEAEITIGGKTYQKPAGTYYFYSQLK